MTKLDLLVFLINLMPFINARIMEHIKLSTVGYARTNVIGSRSSFVIASVRSSIR
jgi:hypothetical protein